MKTILTPLVTAIEALIATMNSTRTAIYDEANARKAALAKAVADMQEAKAVMSEFVVATDMLADAAGEFQNDMDVSVTHVGAMVSDMDVFETPIEKFDGLCDKCGKEMTRDEDQYMDWDGDGFVCSKCEHELHPEPEFDDINEAKEA